MRKLLIAICAITLVTTACKKEASHEDPNSTPGSGGGSTGTKLVRQGLRIGDDSTTLDYTYNGLDHLIHLAFSGTLDNTPLDVQVFINRDAADVITSTVSKSPYFVPIGYETDSLVVTYEYDKTAGHYTHGVSHYVLDDEPQSDSTVFNYDAAGNLTSAIAYFDDGTGYVAFTKEEYTYASNNLTTVKYYDFDGSSFVLSGTDTFEYDSKVNPRRFVTDAPVLGMLAFYSVNNPVKQTTVDNSTQETTVITTAYSYNSADRPTTANETDGTDTSTISYYYQ